MFSKILLVLSSIPWLVVSLASTDSIQDADGPQSGYLPNHNIQPAVVASSSFGQLWTHQFGAKELWYAKPLVYTPNGGTQLVFTASAQNWIRTLDAINGTVLNQRQVMPPFLQSDIGCYDIPGYIGIIGTPIMDPTTETVYFFAKGYKNNGVSGGVLNGIYKFFAVNINTLADVPGFPVTIDGNFADNDPTRYFLGGTVLQRPALAMVGNYVIGAFGGHCDLFNYTGMVISVSKTPNVGVTSLYAMEVSPGAPTPQPLDYTVQQGGKAGIWQAGMGISTDGSRIFFATGNGQGHVNGQLPASGRTGLTTLDECVVNLAVDSNGKLSLSDYFEPYEYTNLDAADRDLGSGGVALLDPSVFRGTNGVAKIAVTIGKNGKAYILNADNLGGFKQGPGGADGIIQTIIAQGAVFGGPGAYPLEGGYIYFTPIGYPTVAYKFGVDGNGVPLFTYVGQTADVSAGRVGVGIPTITTYKGQPGTGILWITDVDAGLRAYQAVPDASGTLVKIQLPPTGGLNKFQRPAFGDGRLYVSDTNGNIICLGSPVANALQCSQPIDFGLQNLGTSNTLTVNCTALIAITQISGVTTGDPTFIVSNSSLPTGPLAQGTTFSFPVTWNLNATTVNNNNQTVSYPAVKPGVKSSVLTITTINAVPKYATTLPISLQGTTVSSSPFLNLAPLEVDFGGLVVGSATTSLTSALIITNQGAQKLTFSGFAWTTDTETLPINYTNVTTTMSAGIPVSTIGADGVFTSSDFPVVGSTLDPGASKTIPLNFSTQSTGQYQSFLSFFSNGGSQLVLLTGSASTAPIGNISVSTSEGGYDPNLVMDFGDVTPGTILVRNIRICNSGGSNLTITKSKPPVVAALFAQHPSTDLHEGQAIGVNQCALGPVEVDAPSTGPNQPATRLNAVWTLNTDDPTFGVRDVAITVNLITNQIGPLLPNGTARYQYLGCYYDGAGRNLPVKLFTNQTGMENGICQQGCYNAGYKFAGTQYKIECWCGNNPPLAINYHPLTDKKCSWGCPGDTTLSQSCGGPGTFEVAYYDTTRYTPGCEAIPCAATSSSTSVVSSTVAPSSTSLSSSAPSSTLSSISSSPLTSTTTISTSSISPTSSGPAVYTGPPVVLAGNINFTYYGCVAEPSGARALSKLVLANDTMTEDYCLSLCYAYQWVGLEYARECWCGNTLNPAATNATASQCNLPCKGNTSEYCGAGNRLNMFTARPVVVLPTSSTSTTISSSAPTSTSSTISSSAPSSNSSSVSSSAPSSTSSIPSSAPSSTSSSVSSSAPSSTSSISSSAPSSTSSISSSAPSSTSSVSSSPSTSTTITSATNSATTSTTPTTTTTTSTTVPPTSTSTTTSLIPTTLTTTTSTTGASPSSTSAIPTPTLGFYYAGCYADLNVTGHSMKLIVANNSMSVEYCISAAKAALVAPTPTTYHYIGVQYGRECYGSTSAPTPEPSSLTGQKACTMTCSGNGTEKCGGPKQYNIYYSLTDTSGSPVLTPWSTPPGVFTTGLPN